MGRHPVLGKGTAQEERKKHSEERNNGFENTIAWTPANGVEVDLNFDPEEAVSVGRWVNVGQAEKKRFNNWAK